MRLAIAITFLVILQLAYIGKLDPITQFSEIEILWGSVVLGFWALSETFLLRSGTVIAQSPVAVPKVDVDELRARASSEKALLEGERDELRAREVQSILRQKELEEQIATLKSKLKEMDRLRTNTVDEQVIARQAVLSFLGSLQDKGRLIDFLMDDVSPYTDQQVGAAARVVHQGCNSVLRQQLSVTPIFSGEEGSSTTLEAGYSAPEWRLIGSVKGNPPYKGCVLHRGWKADRVELARPVLNSSSAKILAPAELEVN